MTYQIDQSNKIEETNKTTYVALTNSKTLTIKILAKDKQELKFIFRKLGKPLIFKLFTFSVLCAKLIIKSKVKTLIIDDEYSGHARQIKSFILQIIRIENKPEPEIIFDQIGKNSPAHIIVNKIRKIKKANLDVKVKEVLYYYERVNKS